MQRALVIALTLLTACGGSAKKSELPMEQPTPVEQAPATTPAPETPAPILEAPPPPGNEGSQVEANDDKKQPAENEKADDARPPALQPAKSPIHHRVDPKRRPSPKGGSTTKKSADPCEGGE